MTQPPLYEAIESLQRLADLYDRRREQIAREVGLSISQWRVLDEIAQEEFMPSLFARQRDCSAAAVSKTLRQLQDKGLVSVRVSPDDGRQRLYALTASGRRLLQRVQRSRARAIEAIWSDLDPRDLARFTRFNRALSARLESYHRSLRDVA
jgi:DNA-binding MarR family transcriptional regulator